MTPNLNHSIEVHNQIMKGWWKRPEYIRERKAFVKRNPICNRCGRPSTTPGHSHEQYRNYETYLAAVANGECEPLCSSCNMQERKGKKPCPLCVSRKSEVIHYIGQYQEECFYCLPDAVIEKRELRKAGYKKWIRDMRDADNAKRREEYKRRKSVEK